MIKLPFSLKERVGSLKTPLHTLYDTPEGGPNWGILPEDDMMVEKMLQRTFAVTAVLNGLVYFRV